MESRNDKMMRLFGLIVTNGSQFNDLKLEQLLKIAGQPDINIDIDLDNGGAVNETAANVTTFSDNAVVQRQKDVPGTLDNNEQPAKRRRQTNMTARVVHDLTLDQGGGRTTGCVCEDYCGRDCVCYETGGACCETCGCEGERGCGLRIKVFKALFGSHLNIKLTPCFAEYISYVSQDAHRNAKKVLKAPRLLKLLGAKQNSVDIQSARGCLVEVGEDHEGELSGLLHLLLVQVLLLKNHGAPRFPFRSATKSGEGAALVAWRGKWMATSGQETREALHLDQELLRYALTDEPHYDCYYSFCAEKWESKSSKFHCEACKQCRPSSFAHCVTCQCRVSGDLAFHRAEDHNWSLDDD